MAVKKITQAGHPALKTKNKIVTSFKSPEIKKLIKDLKDTMYETDLVGTAAPQIGQNYMVFVTHPRTTEARKLPKEDVCRVYINPKIEYLSKRKTVIYEGCGSIPNIFGPVLRPAEVKLTAFDENGQKFSLLTDGLLARVIQHEYDHLMGKEFIQNVQDYNKVIIGTYYHKNIRNSKDQIEAGKITKIEYKKL